MTDLNAETASPDLDPATLQAIDRSLAPWSSTEIWADPGRALTAATWAMRESNRLGYVAGSARATLVLATIHHLNGNCSGSEALLAEAEALYASIDDELGLARVVCHRGFIWLEREQFATALEAQPGALETARRLGDIELEVELLNDMGTQLHYAGHLDEAIRCLYAGLERARELPARNWEAYLTMNIGATSIERSEIIESREWIESAGAIFVEIGHRAGQAYVEINLAEIAERQGDLQAALDHLHQARSLVVDRAAHAHACFESGRIRAELDDVGGAIAAFGQSAALWRAHQDEYQNGLAALADWQVARLTRSWDDSLLSNLQAAEHVFSRSGGSVRKLFRILDALIDTCRHLGRFELALDYADRAVTTKEQFWMHLAEQRSMLTSKLHQLRDAQVVAERERVRRHQIEQLYQENEALVLQLREQTALLERQAIEDPLTQLGNRRYFDGHLERELVRSARFERPLAVALIDVDQFKQVNDMFNHGVGDRVLKRLAEIMRTTCRETDYVARYGGEEFVILFPETDLADAVVQSERLRVAVEQHYWSDLGEGLSVTISTGLVAGDGASSFQRLMASADAMLYLAKHRGRNQVRSISIMETAIELDQDWQDGERPISAEPMRGYVAVS